MDLVVTRDAKCHSVAQRDVDLHQREVERERRDRKRGRAVGHKVDGFVVERVRVYEVAQVAVLDHHAFWSACRARGVNAVNERIRGNIDVWIVGFFGLIKLADGQRLIRLSAQKSASFIEDLVCGDHKAAARVGEAVVDTVVGIAREHRQERAARLDYSVFGGDSVHGSRQEHTYGFAELEPLAEQGVGDPVGALVELGVCELNAVGDDRLVSGSLFDLSFKQLVDAEHLNGIVGLIELRGRLFLLRRHQGNRAKPILSDELISRLFKRVHKARNERFAEHIGAVLGEQPELSAADENIDRKRELGGIERKGFQLAELAAYQNALGELVLISNRDVGGNIVFRGNLGEGINVVFHTADELLAHGADVLIHAELAVRLTVHGQSLYEHSRAADGFGAASAVVNSGEHGLIREVEAAHRVAERRVEKGVQGNALFGAPIAYGSDGSVGLLCQKARALLFFAFVRLGQTFGIAAAENRVVELLRLGVFVGAALFLLLEGGLKARVGLLFYFGAVVGFGDVAEQNRRARAVKNDMVKIEEQIISRSGLIYYRPAESVAHKLVRAHELALRRKLFAFFDAHPHEVVFLALCADVAAVVHKQSRVQIRMSRHSRVDRFFKPRGINSVSECDQERNVVHRGVGTCDAGHENAVLSLGDRVIILKLVGL